MPLGDEQIDYPLPNPDENERTEIGDDGDVPIAPIEEGDEAPDEFDEEDTEEEVDLEVDSSGRDASNGEPGGADGGNRNAVTLRSPTREPGRARF